MQTDKASIFVDAQNLRRLFYEALKDMSKGDRVMFGERTMCEIGDFIASFVMAYDFPDERNYYIRKMVAQFAVVRLDLEAMAELNIYKGKLNKYGDPVVKGEIFECVGRIDMGISKWRNSLKGKD